MTGIKVSKQLGEQRDCRNLITLVSCYIVALGGLVVSVLATGPKVRGFDPGRGRWIFKGDKNP
jgi:hypothetical protein